VALDDPIGPDGYLWAAGSRWEKVAGARRADDVREGGVLDGLILGGEPPVVLELVLPPGRDVELLQEDEEAREGGLHRIDTILRDRHG
jgi:hypothetical protein